MMKISGSIVAMVTPMDNGGDIDKDALTRLVDFHIENQTDGIVAVGTTGESATLSHEENIEVISTVKKLVAGRIPVIGGTGSNSTREAIHLTRQAEKAGVDACLLVTPYYNKPPQHGLVQHFKSIAEAVNIPIILYNVPGRTSCDMLPPAVAELAKIPNIIGIKEAVEDLDRIRELRKLCPENFVILSGHDPNVVDAISIGAQGVISVTANVAPKLMHDMCDLALKGDFTAAKAIEKKLNPLHQALFVEPSPIPSKWALSKKGLIQNRIRLPLTPLSEHCQSAVKSAMNGL